MDPDVADRVPLSQDAVEPVRLSRGWRWFWWAVLGILASAALGPCLFYVGYVTVNAVNCPAFYNPDVNDFCGWRAPDEGAVAVPEGWTVITTSAEGSCGSGGCIYRAWVLEASAETTRAVDEYVAAAAHGGWLSEELSDGEYLKRGDVCLRPFASSSRQEWKLSSVDTFNDPATADRRILVVGNLVYGGARWDGPRPPTTGPLDVQCGVGL